MEADPGIVVSSERMVAVNPLVRNVAVPDPRSEITEPGCQRSHSPWSRHDYGPDLHMIPGPTPETLLMNQPRAPMEAGRRDLSRRGANPAC